jgi:two-component system, OmpR family, sensor histidine kinase KdpD
MYGGAGGRGQLRIYLGYAPGAGTTCALLSEGRRRAERGTDVVVAHVETHGRPGPCALLAGLEAVAPAGVPYRGTIAEEMDIGAVLARRPQLALVDELAHTNVPGGRHATRRHDVEDLLAAGIEVISTVSIGHLASLADVVEKITGAAPGPAVPDLVVRAAHEVELVDLAPQALRERMARGHIYPPRQAEAALSGWFQIANLSLLWLAAKLASDPQRYRPGGHEDVSAALLPFADAEKATQLGADIGAIIRRGQAPDGHRPDRARTTTRG